MLTLAVVLALAAGASSEFSFATPPGWKQVTPDFSSLEQQGVSPEVARLARRPNYALMAVAPTADGHCPSTMVASVLPRPFHITNRTLASVVRGIQDSTTRAGLQVQVHDVRVVEHDGHNIGVIRSSGTFVGCAYEQIAYLLPGSTHMAQIVFSATQRELPAVERLAEDTAFRTGGVHDSANIARLAAGVAFDNPGDRDYALGALCAYGVMAAAAWSVWRVMRRRAKAA